MVKQKIKCNDEGEPFQPHKYSNLPHSEYRTVFHVIVMTLQPNRDNDMAIWQQCANIWNHTFTNDLKANNVRIQDGKHWRDQYVCREHENRPQEWRNIVLPDEQQSKEEL